MNETIKQLFDRKSVRVFTNREISAENKALIIASAAQAPTAGNQQLYTILDITDQSIKDRLAVTCDNQPFIAKARMVLIFLADCRKWYRAYQEAGCQPRKPGAGDFLIAFSDANIADTCTYPRKQPPQKNGSLWMRISTDHLERKFQFWMSSEHLSIPKSTIT